MTTYLWITCQHFVKTKYSIKRGSLWFCTKTYWASTSSTEYTTSCTKTYWASTSSTEDTTSNKFNCLHFCLSVKCFQNHHLKNNIHWWMIIDLCIKNVLFPCHFKCTQQKFIPTKNVDLQKRISQIIPLNNL